MRNGNAVFTNSVQRCLLTYVCVACFMDQTAIYSN